jgi:hypothetical protein
MNRFGVYDYTNVLSQHLTVATQKIQDTALANITQTSKKAPPVTSVIIKTRGLPNGKPLC